MAWDDTLVRLSVAPPGGQPWAASFRWAEIERVCFEAEDLWLSDCVHLFVAGREASWSIPTEAEGGSELWDEVVRRGLFEADLALEAVQGTGKLTCWPRLEANGRRF